MTSYDPNSYDYERTPNGHRLYRLPELFVRLTPDELEWPLDRDAASGNRGYSDFSKASWVDVDAVLITEGELLDDVLARHPQRPLVDLGDEVDRVAFDRLALQFDFGTCAATLALNAAGCPTTTACAGHVDGHPDIVFWTRTRWISLLVESASAARVGIGNALNGTAEVFTQADDPTGLHRFARELRARADRFASITAPDSNPNKAPSARARATAAKRKKKQERISRKKTRSRR